MAHFPEAFRPAMFFRMVRVLQKPPFPHPGEALLANLASKQDHAQHAGRPKASAAPEA